MTTALSFASSAGTTLLPDMCPQRLGVAWSLRWMATTPGLLVIARADDVDGVVVTGIKRQGRLVDTQDDMLMFAVARALSRRKQGLESPRERQ